MKRILFSLVMLFALLVTSPAFAADKGHKGHDCSTMCNSCAKTCEDALKACEEKGGKHADKAHTDKLKDCIAICKACSDLGARNSKLAGKLRAVCAEACKTCATSCDSLKDDKLKDCVKACNDCASMCQENSK